MGPHQTFPEFAVVRHGKMQQLMDDNVITNGSIHN
jgi:hypothetical protein